MGYGKVRAVSVVGFLMMVFGLIAYVDDPSVWAQALFILGLIALVASYVLMYLSGKAADAYRCELESMGDSGYMYVLDKKYVASVNDATITDLTEE